jgi:2-polyprenyl-6-methoxyphenol hydroxylase-like FAD-dependent oxidoreductase
MQGIMLKRLGHNVHLLERSLSSERLEGGIGITIGPDALDFFRRYDLMKQPFSVSNLGFLFLDDESKVKRFMKRPMEMSAWNRLHYNLRANFDGYKSSMYPEPPSSLKGDGEAVFSVGKKVINVENTDGSAIVQYQDLLDGGLHSLEADLVIVADGGSSQIRPLLLPQVQRKYAGYLAWRGCVDESEVSDETRKIIDPNFTSYICKGGYILRYDKTIVFPYM